MNRHVGLIAAVVAFAGCRHQHAPPLESDGAVAVDGEGIDGSPDAAACLPNGLFAARSDLALPGTSITLEGSFRSDVAFSFTGAADLVPSSLGSQRATVMVPASARSGDLTATCNAPAPVPFQRVTFAPTLSTFSTMYEQTAGAARAPTVFLARAAHTAVQVRNSVYLIGGNSDANGWETGLERAVINADGSLGVFSVVSGVTLTVPRGFHTATVIGRYLYVVGGAVDTAKWDSVERAEIHADGSLGAFAAVPTHLVKARSQHTSEIIGAYLYVFGGLGSAPSGPGTVLDSVERAPIASDGSLGAFELVPAATLVTGRLGHSSVVYGNHVYVIGGGNFGNAPLGDVERAPIDSDGNVGPFETLTGISLVRPRSSQQNIVIGNELYVIGGFAGTDGIQRSIEHTTINDDGSLGAFSIASGVELSIGRIQFAIVHVGDYVYAISGISTLGGPLTPTCERASLTGSSLGAFAATSAIAARSGHTSLVSGTRLYLIGGVDGSTAVGTEQAALDPDGALGAFAAGPDLAQPRAGHALVTAWAYAYVVGGHTASGTVLDAIERSSIATDGSLGPFANVTVTHLVSPRDRAAAAVVGTKLFVIGGAGASGAPLGSVEQATINPGGSLSPMATVSGVALTTPRQGHAVAVIGSSVYVLGGADAAGSALASIEMATINPDGTLTGFSHVADLAVPRSGLSVAVVGHTLFAMGGTSGGAPVATIESATIDPTGSLGAFSTITGLTLSTPRAATSAVATGNYLYVTGGANANGALTSIDRATLE